MQHKHTLAMSRARLNFTLKQKCLFVESRDVTQKQIIHLLQEEEVENARSYIVQSQFLIHVKMLFGTFSL